MSYRTKFGKVITALVLLSLLIFFPGVSTGEESEVIEDDYLWTDKDVYEQGEDVIITVKNDGAAVSRPIIYDFGIQIVNVESDEVVYGPLAGDVLPTVPEYGHIEEVKWDQTDTDGEQVQGGRYRIEATQRDFEHTAEFNIGVETVDPIYNTWIIAALTVGILVALVMIHVIKKEK